MSYSFGKLLSGLIHLSIREIKSRKLGENFKKSFPSSDIIFVKMIVYLCGETLKTTPKGLAPIQPSHWLVAEVCRHGSL